MLGEGVIQSLRLLKRPINNRQPEPHILNYRFKKGTGEWIWLQHTVYNISYHRTGKVAKVLHRLRLLEVLQYPPEPTNVSRNPLLKDLGQFNSLTDREKQVLKLIAEGLSTKMIADHLKISITTVETYRKHLLEKLAAKNSMELIKKAFALFWS